jgi:hypothetical protein
MRSCITIADFEREQSLAARYFPIVAAAGYQDILRDLTPADAHGLAGRIMHDREVERILESSDRFKRFTDRTFPSVYDPDYIGILAALGENGRALLRERIHFQPK